MVPLTDLWLPILLASVAVVFISFLLRMVSRQHYSDYSKLPDEEAVREALRAAGVGQGQYSFPHCDDPATMKSAAFQESWAKGPSGMLHVCPAGPWTMGKSLGQWFAMSLFVSTVIAWLVGLVLAPGADWHTVAKLSGSVAFMSYGCAEICTPIWKAGSWKACCMELLDCALYGFAVGGVFVYFWPGA